MLEEIIPLDPVSFFAFQIPCLEVKNGALEKKHRLPDLSDFLNQESFAEVFLGWNREGIHAAFVIEGSFDHPQFPNLSEGDAIELFIDTRDVKTSGFTTRFCHHFFFLPTIIEANGEPIQAGEITRFRTEDVHPLCEPHSLKIERKKEKKRVRIEIFIPSESLHGYDPIQFNRLGFNYRIHMKEGLKQNFSASDDNFSIESQPSLWTSLQIL